MQLLRKSFFRLSLFKYLLLASVNENHEMYMKDSVSAAEVGTGQYATTKGISQTNLITTVTPEKKAEEEKDDEEGKKKRAEEVTPVSAIRHDTKVELGRGGLNWPVWERWEKGRAVGVSGEGGEEQFPGGKLEYARSDVCVLSQYFHSPFACWRS